MQCVAFLGLMRTQVGGMSRHRNIAMSSFVSLHEEQQWKLQRECQYNVVADLMCQWSKEPNFKRA